MTFETDIKKLQKMWEATQDNGGSMDLSRYNQQQMEDTKIKTLPNKITIEALNTIGGDYQQITSLMTTPYQVSGFQWTITKVIPESWVPLIRIDVTYKFTGSDDAFQNVPSYFNKVLNVVDATPGFVTATWQIGLFYISYDPTQILPSFSAKLLFTLVDPSQAS